MKYVLLDILKQNGNLRKLLFSELISSIGTRMYQVSILWWMYQVTGSKSLVGLLMIAIYLPGVLLSPIVGSYVDRYSQKSIIVAMNILQSTLMLLMLLSELTNHFGIKTLIAFTVIISLSDILLKPALKTIVPLVAGQHELVQVNSAQQVIANIAKIIGPVLGTLVFSFLGISGILVVNLLSFACAAIIERTMTVQNDINHNKKTPKTIKMALKESYSYLMSNFYILSIILLICILNLFTGATHILLPSFIQDDIGLSEIAYSAALSSLAIGSLVTSVMFSGLKEVKNSNRVLTLSLITYGISMISLSLSSSIVAICAMFAIIGGAMTTFNVIVISILQTSIPKEIRGQVFTIVIGVSKGLLPVSYGIFGIVGDLFSNVHIFIFVGCILVCGGLFMQIIKQQQKEIDTESEMETL